MSTNADLDLTAFLFEEEAAPASSPSTLLEDYRQRFNTAGEAELLAELELLKKELSKAKRQKSAALKKGSSDLASKEAALEQLQAQEEVILNHLHAIGVDPRLSKKSSSKKKKEEAAASSLLAGLMEEEEESNSDSSSTPKSKAKGKTSFSMIDIAKLEKEPPLTSSLFAAKVEEGEVEEEVDSLLELDIEEIIAQNSLAKATTSSTLEASADQTSLTSNSSTEPTNPTESAEPSAETTESITDATKASKSNKGKAKKAKNSPALPEEAKEDLEELFADHDNSVFALFGGDLKELKEPSAQSVAAKKIDNPFKNKDRRGAFGSPEMEESFRKEQALHPNAFSVSSQAKSSELASASSPSGKDLTTASTQTPKISSLNLEALSFLNQSLDSIVTTEVKAQDAEDSRELSYEEQEAQAQQLRTYLESHGLAEASLEAEAPLTTPSQETAPESSTATTRSQPNAAEENLFASASSNKGGVGAVSGTLESSVVTSTNAASASASAQEEYVPYPPLYNYGKEGYPPIPDYPRVKVDPNAGRKRGARGFFLTAEEQAALPKANEHIIKANYYELQTNAGMIEMGNGPGKGVIGNGNLDFKQMPPQESHPKTNWRDYFDGDVGPDRCLFMDDQGNPLFAENFEFNPSEYRFPPFTRNKINEVDATTAYPPGIEPIKVKPVSVFSPASSYVPWSQELEDRYVEVVKIYDEVVAAREAEARAFASDEEQAALRLIEKTAREHREAEEAAYPLYDFEFHTPARLAKVLNSGVAEATIEEYKAAWHELDALHVAEDKSFFDHERSREDRDKIVDLYIKSQRAIKAEEKRPQVIIDPVMEVLPERHYENGDEVVLALPVTPRMVVEYNLCRSRPDDYLRRGVVHRTFGKIHELRRKALEEIIVPFEKEDGTMEGEEGISNFEVDLYTQFPDLIPNYTDFPFSGPAYMQRIHSLGFELLFFDTETTGMNLTSPEKQIGHRVVTIGMVPFYKGRIMEEEALEFTFKPEREIEYGARKVHGIEDYMVKDHPPFAKYVNDIRRQFEGRVVIAHNSNFDVTFIDQELEIAGADWRLKDICLVCDSLKLSKRMHDTTRHTLDALSEDYDVKIDRDLHGAKLDSVILANVYVKMMEQYMPNLFKLAGIEKKFRRPIYDLPYIEPDMDNADVVSRRVQLSEQQWKDSVEFQTFVLSQVEAHEENIKARKDYAEEQAELAAQEKARLEEEARLAALPEVEVETSLMPEEEALLKN